MNFLPTWKHFVAEGRPLAPKRRESELAHVKKVLQVDERLHSRREGWQSEEKKFTLLQVFCSSSLPQAFFSEGDVFTRPYARRAGGEKCLFFSRSRVPLGNKWKSKKDKKSWGFFWDWESLAIAGVAKTTTCPSKVTNSRYPSCFNLDFWHA